ncbi:hypothetical protein C8Q80DRAFT_616050 [Daedaleopsis nitida]|nr:hypothetical protein C8Q80DRAFT_616050 [Daedaleopsis nitida]
MAPCPRSIACMMVGVLRRASPGTRYEGRVGCVFDRTGCSSAHASGRGTGTMGEEDGLGRWWAVWPQASSRWQPLHLVLVRQSSVSIDATPPQILSSPERTRGRTHTSALPLTLAFLPLRRHHLSWYLVAPCMNSLVACSWTAFPCCTLPICLSFKLLRRARMRPRRIVLSISTCTVCRWTLNSGIVIVTTPHMIILDQTDSGRTRI